MNALATPADVLAHREGQAERIQRLKIQNKEGFLQEFRPLKMAQRQIHSLIHHCHYVWQIPCRILVLKNRKIGITTYGVAYMFDEVNELGRQALIVSQDGDTSDYVVDMIRRFVREMENSPKLDSNTRGMLKWPSIGHIEAFTARSGASPRSRTAQITWFTEAAHSQEEIAVALGGNMQALGTTWVLETTANMEDPLFHSRWVKAYKRVELKFKERPDGFFDCSYEKLSDDWNGWFPYFSGVLQDEDCYLPFNNQEEKDELIRTLDPEGRAMMKFGVTAEFLKWRDFKLRTEYNNDAAAYNQENPWSPEMAFQLSSRVRFHHGSMKQWIVKEPRRGACVPVSDVDPKIVFRPDEYGLMRLYEPPDPAVQYVISLDAAEGIIHEGRKKPDRSVIGVYNPITRSMVAYWGGYVPDHECLDPLLRMAVWYNMAYMVVEVNGPGAVVMKMIIDGKLYPMNRIYHRKKWESGGRQNVAMPGIKTTGNYAKGGTRDVMIGRMADAIRNGGFTLCDDECVPGEPGGAKSEFLHFVWNDAGRVEAAPGWNDDHVFATMFCVEGSYDLQMRMNPLLPIVQGRPHPQTLLDARRRDRVKHWGGRPMRRTGY